MSKTNWMWTFLKIGAVGFALAATVALGDGRAASARELAESPAAAPTCVADAANHADRGPLPVSCTALDGMSCPLQDGGHIKCQTNLGFDGMCFCEGHIWTCTGG